MTAKRDRMPKEEKHPEKMTSYIYFFLTNLINICFSIEISEKKNKTNLITPSLLWKMGTVYHRFP